MPDVPVPEVFVTDADDSQASNVLASDTRSPGEMLLQARLQAGLSQEQLAKKLYVTVAKVNALEADDYSRLSSDTFARGYIRAYANAVNLDLELVLAAYDALLAQLQPQANVQPKAHAVVENSHRGAWQFLALIGVFFIALWLISVWFFDNHSDEPYLTSATTSSANIASAELKTVPAATNMTALSANASSVSLAISSAGESQPVVVTSAAAVQNLNSATTGAAIDLSAPPAHTAKKIALDTLSFSFKEESWLEVSDSRGDVLATELQATGSKLQLVGLAPFDVKLGNAPAVEVYLNGTKIDVIPLMGSNVLTLKIGN